MSIIELLEDFWYVNIRKLHKHKYVQISDAVFVLDKIGENKNINRIVAFQRHQCTECGNIVGLDSWQIADLPPEMKYQSIDDIKEEMKRKDLIWKEQ